MGNRQQNQQSGMQRYGSNRSWDEDDNRSMRDWGRDYGQYADEEGESAGQYGRRDEQRHGQSGQSRHGQPGYGQSNYGQPNYSYGRPSYGQDYGSSGTSNYGSSRYEREGDYSRGRSGHGYGGEGSFSGPGGWREPSGEGQQYGYRGEFSQQGQHRGKGPKNYQRSDERVKEMLCERLHDDPEIDASEVTVNVQGGRITLEGTVDSRRTKMAIEDVAEQVGSQDVQNNLRVQKQGERMETGGRSASSMGKSALGADDADQGKQKRN